VCFNRNVLDRLGSSPSRAGPPADAIGAALPLLVLLACPLSMLFMSAA